MGKTSSKRILSVIVKCEPDQDADTSYLEQDEFEDRLRQYRDGQFGYCGIYAQAEITMGPAFAVQRVQSAGLWGIEDDSDREHFDGIVNEELTALRTELHAMGFSTRAISKAFQNIERN